MFRRRRGQREQQPEREEAPVHDVEGEVEALGREPVHEVGDEGRADGERDRAGVGDALGERALGRDLGAGGRRGATAARRSRGRSRGGAWALPDLPRGAGAQQRGEVAGAAVDRGGRRLRKTSEN